MRNVSFVIQYELIIFVNLIVIWAQVLPTDARVALDELEHWEKHVSHVTTTYKAVVKPFFIVSSFLGFNGVQTGSVARLDASSASMLHLILVWSIEGDNSSWLVSDIAQSPTEFKLNDSIDAFNIYDHLRLKEEIYLSRVNIFDQDAR